MKQLLRQAITLYTMQERRNDLKRKRMSSSPATSSIASIVEAGPVNWTAASRGYEIEDPRDTLRLQREAEKKKKKH